MFPHFFLLVVSLFFRYPLGDIGVERNKKALTWLKQNEFEVLYHMALAGDGEELSLKWLIDKHRDFAHIAMKIKKVKDDIQDDNDDPHKISKV